MDFLVGIVLALVLCFMGIRIAAIIGVCVLIEAELIDVEQAKELYKEFIKLEHLKRKDDDRWRRK